MAERICEWKLWLLFYIGFTILANVLLFICYMGSNNVAKRRKIKSDVPCAALLARTSDCLLFCFSFESRSLKLLHVLTWGQNGIAKI
uniref:Uncharacterized protein n=1 Tax=Ixodes scapularis TaxID=6945 RepID=A0A4D5S207_IXOSC